MNKIGTLITSGRGLSLLIACAFCLMLHLANLFAMLGARSGAKAENVELAADLVDRVEPAPYRTMPILAPRRVQQAFAPVPQALVPTESADRSHLISPNLIDAESPDPLQIREKQMDMLRQRALAPDEDSVNNSLTLEEVVELEKSGAMIW